jgi:phage terminase large subunit-like protein
MSSINPLGVVALPDIEPRIAEKPDLLHEAPMAPLIIPAHLSYEQKVELLELLAIRDRKRRENLLARYKPYPKQEEFHRLGAVYRERLFMAGNQLGKTISGAAEVAMHLTGRYPAAWTGLRMRSANRWIVGSESVELTKKGVQRLLFGNPDVESDWGTGMIPKDAIVSITRRQGPVANCIGGATIKHEDGNLSNVALQSYDQGRSKWQADTVDGIWFDEEPPLDLYSEGITRTNVTRGPVIVTFTPLLGMSDVVKRFLIDKQDGSIVINMTIQDALHYSPADRAAIIASYPEHEREARANGVPMMGRGRVFPVAESTVKVDAFALPSHWPRIVGMDFGIDHPCALAWLAWDRDTDTIYVYDAWRERNKTILDMAQVYRPRGAWIPAAWPHDGLQRDKGSGVQIAKQAKDAGIATLAERATFDDGSNGVEAGLSDMLQRMQTRRLRVFSHLTEWFEEFRMYHRKDGQVVKAMDDLLSATRYALMMKRHAMTEIEANPSPFGRGFGLEPGSHMLDPIAGY